MHDLVHDLACLVSKSDFSFKNFERVEDVGQICRLSSSLEILKSLSPSNKVRTYMFSSALPKYSVKLEFGSELSKFKYLRVLDLHRAYVTELPSCVGKLRHLRFLDLSETFVKTLPDSVCNLYHLQTLRLSLCEKLCELPKDMKKQIRLRHLVIDGCTKLEQMPRYIGHLSSLQTLSKFIVGEEDSGCSIGELECLNLGGKLEIEKLEMVRSAAAATEAKLVQKSNIESLKLSWLTPVALGDDIREGFADDVLEGVVDDVLEGLQPHSNLKKLEIWLFSGLRFPTWMNAAFLPNLVELHLCGSTCEHLPPLGRLQFLKILEIDYMINLRCIGDEFYSDDIGNTQTQEDVGNKDLFPSLRQLSLKRLPVLEEWMEPALKSFPLLEELEVNWCHVLTKTPTQFPSLKNLRVNEGSESLVKSLSNKASTLTRLRIGGIYDMTSLPQGLLQRNNLLRELIICHSPEIRSLPVEELRNLKSLESLTLSNCKSLTVEPDLISCLTSLRRLSIMGVKEMVSSSSSSSSSLSLSEWQLCKLPFLFSLGIGGFADEPDVFPFIEGIEQIDLLVLLNICGWPKLTTLPEQLQHLTKLQAL